MTKSRNRPTRDHPTRHRVRGVTLAGLLLWAWSLASASIAAGPCLGRGYCLSMTILPSATSPPQHLDVSLDLFGLGETQPQPLAWTSYESWSIAHFLDTYIGGSNASGTVIVPHVVWIAAGGNPDDLPDDRFDFFTIGYSGNLGFTDLDLIENQTYFDLFDPRGALYDSFRTCYFGGHVYTSCPLLNIGQSYILPVVDVTDDGDVFSTFTVTLDSGVPEPAAWVMMAVGVGAIGAARRRFRSNRASSRAQPRSAAA